MFQEQDYSVNFNLLATKNCPLRYLLIQNTNAPSETLRTLCTGLINSTPDFWWGYGQSNKRKSQEKKHLYKWR